MLRHQPLAEDYEIIEVNQAHSTQFGLAILML